MKQTIRNLLALLVVVTSVAFVRKHALKSPSRMLARAALVLVLTVLTATTAGATDYYVAEFNGTNTLTFKMTTTPPNNSTSWDFSDTGGESGNNKPGWYDQREKITKVIFDWIPFAEPKSCYSWFNGCTNLTYIENILNLDTREVTNMESMFEGCSSLTSLDLREFETNNVTNMCSMLKGCSSLSSLDMSNFDTNNVTDMSSMFEGCSSLASLSIGKDFTVGNESTTNTTKMFHGCTAMANCSLIVKGTFKNNTLKPGIAQDIFFDKETNTSVITDGTLDTNLIKEQLGITDNGNPFSWKGGKFKIEGKENINFVDENGVQHTAEALRITSSTTRLEAGWYYVEGDVTINSKVGVIGVANLILCDGATMTVTVNADDVYHDYNICSDCDFTIYSQGGETEGKLTTNGGDYGIIIVNDHKDAEFTINGGQVTVNSPYEGIRADNLTINGGQVVVTGREHGIDCYSFITINGGQVEVTGIGEGYDNYFNEPINAGYGIYAVEGITINGGTVTVTGGGDHGGGMCIGDNRDDYGWAGITIKGGTVIAKGKEYGIYSALSDITLSWMSPTDYIMASSYKTGDGSVTGEKNYVKIPRGRFFNGDGTLYGSANADYVFLNTDSEIADVTLYPAVPTPIGDGTDKYIEYCSVNGNLKLTNDVKAYVVTGYNATTGEVLLSEAPLDGLPKGVPAILMMANGSNLPAQIYLSHVTGTEADKIANSVEGKGASPLFVAGDGTKTVAELIAAATGGTDTSEYMVFVLSNSVFKPVTFSDTSVPADGVCLLIVSKWDVLQMVRNGVTPSASGARGIAFELGETDMRPTPGPSLYGGEWYDLQGRRLSGAPTAKGIYIHNGRLVVIK